MNEPPQDRVDSLIQVLLHGEPLKMSDRMIALWFIRKVQGQPTLDESEVEKYDKALDEFIDAKS